MKQPSSSNTPAQDAPARPRDNVAVRAAVRVGGDVQHLWLSLVTGCRAGAMEDEVNGDNSWRTKTCGVVPIPYDGAQKCGELLKKRWHSSKKGCSVLCLPSMLAH